MLIQKVQLKPTRSLTELLQASAKETIHLPTAQSQKNTMRSGISETPVCKQPVLNGGEAMNTLL